MNAMAADCMHSNRTPGGVPAGGSADAGAVDHMITGTACFTDLRDHAVLMERRERCGLRRCSKGQGKGDSDQSDHCFLLCDLFKERFLEGCSDLSSFH